MKLTERLPRTTAPGEGAARARAWRLAAAAHAEREPRPRGAQTRRRALALAGAACAIAAATAFSPPGEAVAEWVGRTVRHVVDPPPPRPAALGALPGGGRILLFAGGAPHITGDRGRRRVVGRVDDATWSGHGRFLAVARGDELAAVDLLGRPRWSITRAAAVRAPRWSPDGFRVAYLAGRTLRVVAGDGTADRLLAPRGTVAARDARRALLARPRTVPPAWRPGPGHVLAYLDAGGRVTVLDADFGTLLYRVTAPPRARAIAFSRTGDRLAVVGTHAVRVFGGLSGRPLQTLTTPRGVVDVAAAYGRGHDLAIVRRRGTRFEVLLARTAGTRRLFAAGALGPVAFSPRGDWLLVDWRETGSWLFLPVGGPPGRRPRQVTGVGRRYGAPAATPAGWCCAP